jgi:hypothetical protein
MGLRAAASLAVVVLIAAGCTTVRNSLGTNDSGCYVALPSAQAAVHDKGALHGVLLVSVTSLRKLRQLHTIATATPSRKVQRVCLVAFTGHFSAASVAMPHGRPVGHFAVVVVEYPDNHVLGTVIFSHTPVHFGHAHFAA